MLGDVQVRWTSTPPLGSTDTWTGLGDATATSYTATGLTNGVTYTFEVRVVNTAGNGAAASTTATPALSVPGAPTGLTATAGDTEVGLAWTLPTNASVLGDVQVRWTSTPPLGSTDTWTGLGDATATSYTATGLTNGVTYTFEVRVVNTAGNGAAASTTATPALSVPGAPTGLTATAGDTEVGLAWTLPTNASVLGDVQVRWTSTPPLGSTDTWTGLGDATATSYTATGLTNGVTYTFEVRVVNTAGNGAAASYDGDASAFGSGCADGSDGDGW